MASFFTRALDKVTPWRRGGELQREQEARQRKKKREEEQQFQATPNKLQVTNVPNNQRVVIDEPLKPQQPENVFEANKNLVLNKPQVAVTPTNNPGITLPDGTNTRDIPDTPEQAAKKILESELNRGKSFEDIARDNNFDLNGVREYAKSTRPNYGIKEIERPKQGIGNRFRDIFDTNTESDKFRRQEGNKVAVAERRDDEVKPIIQEKSGNIVSRTPVVGHVTKMLNTAGAQIAELPATADQIVQTKMLTDLNKQLVAAKKAGKSFEAKEIQRKLDLLSEAMQKTNREIDAGHSMFEKNKGGLFNAGTLYDEETSKQGSVEEGLKDIILPTAVTMADIYTLGRGSAISEGIKQGGIRAVGTTQLPNVLKASGGNFFSGAGTTISEDGSLEEALASGLVNTGLGLAPDIALPAMAKGFQNRVVPQIFRGRAVNPADVIDELDEAGISASAEAANQALRPRRIPVSQNIPINEILADAERVPVRGPMPVTERPGALIQEITGDATTSTPSSVIADRVAQIRRAEADAVNSVGVPDNSVGGIIPRKPEAPFVLDTKAVATAQDKLIDDYASFLRDMGEGNGTQLIPDGEGGYYRTSNNYRPNMGSGKITKAQWREEAEKQLRSGKAESAIQKEFDDAANPELQALLSKGEQLPVEEGRPITVKQATGIPVRDETVVPQNLPETPGTVRVTEANAPANVKAATVAAQTPPTILPKEVQDVLDNPKKYNKRQVAAARNQRKLARQMAKTQEDTAAAMERIEATKAPTTPQGEGFAPTGEFGRGKKGNAYQKASQDAEAAAGRTEMADRSVDNLLEEIGQKESFTPGDRRRISAAIENIAKADPDNIEVRTILKKLQSKSRTELGQALAMIPKVIRRSASADTLVGRWENKIARALENPAKMTDEAFGEVQRANDAFTLARDTAERLNEQFKRTGSEADFKAWEEAYNAARKADTDAKFTEVSVAKRVLKGEKGAHVNKVLDELRKESDVNTMDLVTANMLSSTGTGFRNTFGTELAGIENRVGANLRAKVTKAIFGENVGGYDRSGARLGRKVGLTKFGGDAARRAEIGGKNPLEWAKNWSTTINSGGESSLQSQVYSRLGKYYKNQFADQGFSGKELDMRMRHAMLTDPDAMADVYLDSAMKSSGLTGLFEKGQTIEKAVTDYVGKQTDNKMAQGASKLLMRMMVGFPTATGNFIYQSTKRLTAGLPSYIEMGAKIAKGDKFGAAQAFDRALKETGSGLAILGLGAALGKADMISGPYPSDPEERARWEREGISENSIKIGNAWYPIPQGAGMFGLPLMTGAAIGRDADNDDALKELYSPKSLSKLLPTDQIQGFLNMASGDGAPQDFKNFVASSVRAATPVGALLNQIAKSTDDTKNDTTTKSLGANILDQIYSGIPGVNNMANIPDKTDDAGNPIKNPNPVEIAFGATSASQQAGIDQSGKIQGEIDAKLGNISTLLNDKNIEGVLEEKGLEAYNKLKAGKPLDESDIKALRNGLVKGVSSEGTDTAYLERGEYDTNLEVLKLKKELMEADKTTKPSSLKDVETAIKRGEVYKEHQTPYDLISEYQSVGVDDWRKMGIPPEDEDHDPDLYNPEMYQKLWEIDQLLTKAGVSYRKGALDKNKYFLKEKKAGSGSGSRGGYSSDFGTLKDAVFSPKVQQYQSLDQASGSVPIIRTVRPNIVHKITASR